MKEIITVFISIFVAEIADKTQFAVISFATKSLHPFNIWFAATLAFCVTNLIGIIIGQGFAKICPTEVIKYISGSIFIIIGLVTIIGK